MDGNELAAQGSLYPFCDRFLKRGLAAISVIQAGYSDTEGQ